MNKQLVDDLTVHHAGLALDAMRRAWDQGRAVGLNPGELCAVLLGVLDKFSIGVSGLVLMHAKPGAQELLVALIETSLKGSAKKAEELLARHRDELSAAKDAAHG